jgi:hypothetical protein
VSRTPGAREAEDAPDPGHEHVLRRHGLIDCIAELPEGLPPGEAARFRAEASRIARNVIPLGPRRFGLLLPDAPAAALSSVPHRLSRDGVPAAEPPGGADAPREASAELGAGSGAAPGRAAAGTDPNGHLHQQADAIAAAVEVRMEHLVTRRLEAFERRIAGTTPGRDPLPQARIDAFWTGMESAMRLLGDIATRIEAAGTGAPGDTPATEEGGTLARIEDAIAAGFAAADAAREADRDALQSRLAAIEDRAQATAAAQDGALAGRDTVRQAMHALERQTTDLQAQMRDIESRTGERLDRLDAGLVARLDEAGDAIGRHHAALSEQLQAQSDILGQLAPALQALVASLPNAEATAQPILARIEGLEARLADRGSVLSDSVGTAQRSMKNFWLAAEDALRRIDESLVRLEALGGPDADAASRIDDAAARLEAVEGHLVSMEQRQQAVDQGTAQLRQALTDLLACQARAADGREA